MTTRPNEFPRWASNPPANTLTAPTALQMDEGYQPEGSATFPEGKPVRQIENWLKNNKYEWLLWLDQTTHETGDLHPDQALPAGDTPGLGAGLGPIAAADFSARVYVNGFGVRTTPSPAHTYTADTDTYWDLGEDGWTPVEVTALDPEPAVTANAVRVFMVRTDATDRISLVDRRVSFTQLSAHDVIGTQRCAAEATIDSPGDTDNTARTTPKRTILVDSTSGATWELVETIEGNNALGPMRRYVLLNSSHVAEVFAWGAELQTTSGVLTWIARSTTAQRLFIGRDRSDFAEKTGLTADVTTFTDSEWEAPTAANLVRKRRRMFNGLRFEVDAAGGVIGADANLQAHREDVRGDAKFTLVESDETDPGTDGGERVYLTNDSDVLGGSTARVHAYNCAWNDDTQQWDRDIGGDAFLILFGLTGFYVLRHDASLAASWDDQIGASDWEETFFAGRPGSITGSRCRAQMFIPNLADESGASIDAHALYRNNVPKGWGVVTTDGAGGITLEAGFGVASAVIAGGGVLLTITIDKAMSSQYWAMSFGVCGTGFPVFSASTVNSKSVQIYDSTGTPIDLSATAMRIEFSFDGVNA
jgi:hypothetical protein